MSRRPAYLRRHRRSGVPALLACLLVVAALIAVSPGEEEEPRRRYVDVGIGDRAENRDFAATVTEVRVGRAVLRNDYEPPIRTSASFVVVGITAATPEQTAYYTGIELVTTDGSRYRNRIEFPTNYLQSTMPGFSTTGVAVFEVPPDELPGVVVTIGPDRGTLDFGATVIRVDLGLTDRIRYATEPIVLPEATTGVIR